MKPHPNKYPNSKIKKKKTLGSKTLEVYLKYHFGFFFYSVVSHTRGKNVD